MEQAPSPALLNEIVDRISVGVLVVNKNYELVLWNTYMENYSQKKASEVVGKNLFDCFPDLPQSWLEQKIRNVFILKNFSFTSWEHRPYLFKFLHNRPITGGIDYMRQNCTFLPIKGEDTGEIEYVCITLLDVTDTSIYEGMLKGAVKSLAEASNRDGLTNIYNRRFLEQTMSKEFARIKRYGGTLSFIIIDLDHFKNINDTYGHLAGDEILKIAAKRIGEHLRTSDVLARYGGEEFAVLLPETPLGGADILANRLCENVAKEPVMFGGQEINISASLGVAEFQPDIESHEHLIGRADTVLYLSKENGRNQVTIYDHNNPPNIEDKDNLEDAPADENIETTTEASTENEANIPTEPNTTPDEDTSAMVSPVNTVTGKDDETLNQPTVEATSEANTDTPEVSDEVIETPSSELPSKDTDTEIEKDSQTLVQAQEVDTAVPLSTDQNASMEQTEETIEIDDHSSPLSSDSNGEDVATTTTTQPPLLETENEATHPGEVKEVEIAELQTDVSTEINNTINVDEDTATEAAQTETTNETVGETSAPDTNEDSPTNEETAIETTELTSDDTEIETAVETEKASEEPTIPTEAIVDTEAEAEPERELTAEEKADLAMIEAYGEVLDNNKSDDGASEPDSATSSEGENFDSTDSAEIIDLASQEKSENDTKESQADDDTIYVKLGSK